MNLLKKCIGILLNYIGLISIIAGVILIISPELIGLEQISSFDNINWGIISIIVGFIIFIILRNNITYKKIIPEVARISDSTSQLIQKISSNQSEYSFPLALDIHTKKSLDKVREICKSLLQAEAHMYIPHTKTRDVALILYNLGTALRKMKRYDEALQFYKESLAIHKRLTQWASHYHDKYFADTLNDIGITLCKMRRTHEALTHYKEAEKIYHNLALMYPHFYTQYLVRILINISIFYLHEMQDKAESTYYAQIAMQKMRKYRNTPPYQKYVYQAEQILKQCREVVY